ncbi:MAG TPA: hypothetical protein VIQ23_17285 [Hanamia sp.]
MQHKSLISILLLIISSMVSAQSLQTWTWDTYKMKFRAPDNMIVQQNNADSYQATNNNITLDIYPRTGENLTYDGMKNAISNWANQVSLNYTKGPIYMENINRYWGCAIDGTKQGFSATAVLLVDPDYPDISFYVWISYAREYYHDAVAILRSFQPL